MSFDSWKQDAPDPGTVETDDRCPCCAAGDGEPCESHCECQSCRRRWDHERTILVRLDVLAGEPVE